MNLQTAKVYQDHAIEKDDVLDEQIRHIDAPLDFRVHNSCKHNVRSQSSSVRHWSLVPSLAFLFSADLYASVLFLLSTDHPDLAGRLQAIGAAAGAKANSAQKDLELKDEVDRVNPKVRDRTFWFSRREEIST